MLFIIQYSFLSKQLFIIPEVSLRSFSGSPSSKYSLFIFFLNPSSTPDLAHGT